MLKLEEQGSVYIDNLHAMPGHQGSGSGTAMLDEAGRWALSFRAARLHLLVLDSNLAAIGFHAPRLEVGGQQARQDGQVGCRRAGVRAGTRTAIAIALVRRIGAGAPQRKAGNRRSANVELQSWAGGFRPSRDIRSRLEDRPLKRVSRPRCCPPHCVHYFPFALASSAANEVARSRRIAFS